MVTLVEANQEKLVGELQVILNESTELKEVTKYSFTCGGKHKNALVALLDYENGEVYFGIARCHKTDVFSKKKGRALALNRAYKVYEKSFGCDGPCKCDEPLCLDEVGLKGHCSLDDLNELKKYFYGLEKIKARETYKFKEAPFCPSTWTISSTH